MISRNPANKATGEVFPDWEPVAQILIKISDIKTFLKVFKGEHLLEDIKPFKAAFPEDPEWSRLKKLATDTYRKLKEREEELLSDWRDQHPS